MTLVAALFLVLHLMNEAGKGKNWEWIWKITSDNPDENPLSRLNRRSTINTRLKSEMPDSTGPGTLQLSVTNGLNLAEIEDARFDLESAWSAVFERLGRDHPELVFRFLYKTRTRESWTDDESAAWEITRKALYGAWERVLADARPRPADVADPLPLSDAMRTSLQERADRLDKYWERASQEVFEQRMVSATQELQRILDALAADHVRDDTITRNEEKNIWFRYLERLRDSPANDADVSPVTFVQLFKQPTEYRGQLVRVRGALRLAYRIAAPRNVLGITHYYVFWLHPDGPENSPIVIYALEIPQGFPAIPDREKGGASVQLNETATVTGIFFKRWAYRATDGARLAPLVLAKGIDWEWKSPANELSDGAAITQLALGAGVAAILSVILAVYVYRKT